MGRYGVRIGIAALLPTLLLSQTVEVQSTKGLHLALKESRNNGEYDTIVLASGTYSTQTEGLGTFIYDGHEAYGLTIKAADGVLPESVILTGGNTHRVLELYSTNENTEFEIQGITIRDGKTNEQGAGIYTTRALILDNVRIHDNEAKQSGGGVYASELEIYESKIFSNETESLSMGGANLSGGGGAYAVTSMRVEESNIYLNASEGGGGGTVSPLLKIYNSELYSNRSEKDGGAVLTNRLIMANSLVYNNQANNSGRGGGVMADEFNIYNSTIWNNQSAGSGDGLYGRGSLVNTLLYNTGSDLDLAGEGESYLYHNYLDYGRLKNAEQMDADDVYLQSNIQMLENDPVNLVVLPGSTSTSPYVDKGINPDDASFTKLLKNLSADEESELTSILLTDIDGSLRVHNGIIDVGPQEYGASYVGKDPIIKSFQASGEMKVGKSITFTYEAEVDEEYTITQYAMNYGDGGSYVIVDANSSHYVYSVEGTYTVSLRVTDSGDNVAVQTLNVVIEALIDQDVRDYCTEYPDQCQFGSDDYLTPAQCKPQMDSLVSGWHLLGTGVDFEVSEIPVSYEALWKYPDGNWSHDFTTVEAGQGFWILVP